MRSISDDENWDDSKVAAGFAGGVSFRMVGTEADLNDHWVELVVGDTLEPDDWQRITCFHFRSESGRAHVMSVIDNEPAVTINLEPGDYAVHVAGQNLGVDQRSLGEESELSDAEIASRKDLEWYRIYVVPGVPKQVGRIKDAGNGVDAKQGAAAGA